MAKMVRIKMTPETIEAARRSIDWERVNAMPDEEIERGIENDPDAGSPLTEAQGWALRAQIARNRLKLSQQEFAERFRIPLATLRDWEQARCMPDAAAQAYLTVIARDPEAVLKALAA